MLENLLLYSQQYSWLALKVLTILFAGLYISRRFKIKAEYYFKDHTKDPTSLLFFINAMYFILLLALLCIVLAMLGVPTASLIALLGTIGITIGFAIKDYVSNLVGGMMLVLLKLFKVGDSIEAAGVVGTVDKISLFNTKIHTANNEAIFIPNTKLLTDKLINKTSHAERRIELKLQVGLREDLNKIRSLILELLDEQQHIIPTPSPQIIIAALADDRMNLSIRLWVPSQYYSTTKAAVLEFLSQIIKDHAIDISLPAQYIK